MLNLSEEQADVRSTEPERVLQHKPVTVVFLHVIVFAYDADASQVEGGIEVVDVGRGRHDALSQADERKDGLHAAGGAKQVPDVALVGGDEDVRDVELCRGGVQGFYKLADGGDLGRVAPRGGRGVRVQVPQARVGG